MSLEDIAETMLRSGSSLTRSGSQRRPRSALRRSLSNTDLRESGSYSTDESSASKRRSKTPESDHRKMNRSFDKIRYSYVNPEWEYDPTTLGDRLSSANVKDMGIRDLSGSLKRNSRIKSRLQEFGSIEFGSLSELVDKDYIGQDNLLYMLDAEDLPKLMALEAMMRKEKEDMIRELRADYKKHGSSLRNIIQKKANESTGATPHKRSKRSARESTTDSLFTSLFMETMGYKANPDSAVNKPPLERRRSQMKDSSMANEQPTGFGPPAYIEPPHRHERHLLIHGRGAHASQYPDPSRLSPMVPRKGQTSKMMTIDTDNDLEKTMMSNKTFKQNQSFRPIQADGNRVENMVVETELIADANDPVIEEMNAQQPNQIHIPKYQQAKKRNKSIETNIDDVLLPIEPVVHDAETNFHSMPKNEPKEQEIMIYETSIGSDTPLSKPAVKPIPKQRVPLPKPKPKPKPVPRKTSQQSSQQTPGILLHETSIDDVLMADQQNVKDKEQWQYDSGVAEVVDMKGIEEKKKAIEIKEEKLKALEELIKAKKQFAKVPEPEATITLAPGETIQVEKVTEPIDIAKNNSELEDIEMGGMKTVEVEKTTVKTAGTVSKVEIVDMDTSSDSESDGGTVQRLEVKILGEVLTTVEPIEDQTVKLTDGSFIKICEASNENVRLSDGNVISILANKTGRSNMNLSDGTSVNVVKSDVGKTLQLTDGNLITITEPADCQTLSLEGGMVLFTSGQLESRILVLSDGNTVKVPGSVDGQVLMLSDGNTITVNDTESKKFILEDGSELSVKKSQTGQVFHLANNQVVSATSQSDVCQWNLDNGETVEGRITAEGKIMTLANGEVITVTTNPGIKAVTLADRKMMKMMGEPENRTLTLSDGNVLAVVKVEGRSLTLSDGRVCSLSETPKGKVLTFPDRREVAVVRYSQTRKLLDGEVVTIAETEGQTMTLADGQVVTITRNNRGRKVMTFSDGQAVTITSNVGQTYGLVDGRRIQGTDSVSYGVQTMTFQDGRILAITGTEGDVMNLSDGKEVVVTKTADQAMMKFHDGKIVPIDSTAQGQMVTLIDSRDVVITCTPEGRMMSFPEGYSTEVLQASKTLTLSDGQSVNVSDSDKEIMTLSNGQVATVIVDEDGDKIMMFPDGKNKAIMMVEGFDVILDDKTSLTVTNIDQVQTMTFPNGDVSSITEIKEGDVIRYQDGSEAYVVNGMTGKVVNYPNGEVSNVVEIKEIAKLEDGRLVTIVENIQSFKLSDGRRVQVSLTEEGRILVFPDGQEVGLTAIQGDKLVLASGRKVRAVSALSEKTVNFPDGQMITVTGSTDTKTLSNGQIVNVSHTADKKMIAYPDGKRMHVCKSDGITMTLSDGQVISFAGTGGQKLNLIDGKSVTLTNTPQGKSVITQNGEAFLIKEGNSLKAFKLADGRVVAVNDSKVKVPTEIIFENGQVAPVTGRFEGQTLTLSDGRIVTICETNEGRKMTFPSGRTVTITGQTENRQLSTGEDVIVTSTHDIKSVTFSDGNASIVSRVVHIPAVQFPDGQTVNIHSLKDEHTVELKDGQTLNLAADQILNLQVDEISEKEMVDEQTGIPEKDTVSDSDPKQITYDEVVQHHETKFENDEVQHRTETGTILQPPNSIEISDTTQTIGDMSTNAPVTPYSEGYESEMTFVSPTVTSIDTSEWGETPPDRGRIPQQQIPPNDGSFTAPLTRDNLIHARLMENSALDQDTRYKSTRSQSNASISGSDTASIVQGLVQQKVTAKHRQPSPEKVKLMQAFGSSPSEQKKMKKSSKVTLRQFFGMKPKKKDYIEPDEKAIQDMKHSKSFFIADHRNTSQRQSRGKSRYKYEEPRIEPSREINRSNADYEREKAFITSLIEENISVAKQRSRENSLERQLEDTKFAKPKSREHSLERQLDAKKQRSRETSLERQIDGKSTDTRASTIRNKEQSEKNGTLNAALTSTPKVTLKSELMTYETAILDGNDEVKNSSSTMTPAKVQSLEKSTDETLVHQETNESGVQNTSDMLSAMFFSQKIKSKKDKTGKILGDATSDSAGSDLSDDDAIYATVDKTQKTSKTMRPEPSYEDLDKLQNELEFQGESGDHDLSAIPRTNGENYEGDFSITWDSAVDDADEVFDESAFNDINISFDDVLSERDTRRHHIFQMLLEETALEAKIRRIEALEKRQKERAEKRAAREALGLSGDEDDDDDDDLTQSTESLDLDEGGLHLLEKKIELYFELQKRVKIRALMKKMMADEGKRMSKILMTDEEILSLIAQKDRELHGNTNEIHHQQQQQQQPLRDCQSQTTATLLEARRESIEVQTDDLPETESEKSFELKEPEPEIKPPQNRRSVLYVSADVFEELDTKVIEVAQLEQKTYGELVRDLTRNCKDDLEKARALFRWITVKDLNRIDLDGEYNKNSLLGMLKGIKNGTESYHELFKRLCGYAGLHCHVIKGYSKGVGYRPGMNIEQACFRNTWTAVSINNQWRFVNCNWGARRVEGKDEFEADRKRMKYKCDEFYFCTDPEDHIFQHYPDDHKWQLLRNPIKVSQFRRMPVLKSPFFNSGLKPFTRRLEEKLFTQDGRVEIRLRISKYVGLHCTLDLIRDNGLISLGDGHCLIKVIDDFVVFVVAPPDIGRFYFNIYVADDWKSTSLEHACAFQIIAGDDCYEAGINGIFPNIGVIGKMPMMERVGMDIPASQDPHVLLTWQKEIPFTFWLHKDAKLSHQMKLFDRRGNCLGDYDKYVFFSYKGNKSFIARCPKAGYYVLSIFAAEAKTSTAKLDCVLRFLIECESSVSDSVPFPRPTRSWIGCHLHEPMDGDLEVNKHLKFSVEIPDAKDVAVVVGKTGKQKLRETETTDLWEGMIYTGDVANVAMALIAKFKYSRNEKYSILLDYKIIEKLPKKAA
ncbi:uncharacterized protein LOC141901283 [Tubulanus polymorphus]|uniref:uncharacterized protein LOC141901283 n=1 Tax=Tubulanus polymorphus TaxID=672921 RepID=UPI003DA41FDC